ncbi:eukaryotic translation initiation factor 4 [Haematococcus lacustris]
MADDLEVSLRPVVLKPLEGGANPFSGFSKGAGFGIKAKKASTAATVDDTVVKPDSERVKYARDFLMLFMERYTKCPVEVQQLGMPEIVISEDFERDQQRQVLQKVAEELDDRDWRTRDAVAALVAPAAAKPAENANWEQRSQKEPQQSQQSSSVEPSSEPTPVPATPSAIDQLPAPKIVKASDVGLQAYKPGAQLAPEERAMRTIKGILNKLTPEKFERLLAQLLEVILTADILQQTIALVFENAVEQPTYCAMYADLCLRLSKELPTFPPPQGSNRSIGFRQILLNTCQDEFEGTEAARQALTSITEPHTREVAERNVKKRTLGNMRLLSELYKQDMVKDWIMTQCMETLLTAPKGRLPTEDNVEAACEMITTAGARLAKSEKAETRSKLDSVLKQLEKLGSERSVPSRIRFIIRDILDQRKANWVARREVFTAKKLDEIRGQAEAELGMISSTLTSVLPSLPSHQRLGGGLLDGDVPLLPPLRSGGGPGVGMAGRAGGEADSMAALFPPLRSQAAVGPGSTGAAPGAAIKSVFLGEYQEVQPSPALAPPPQAQAQPAAQTAQPEVAAAAAGKPSKAAATPGAPLSDEELERKTGSLLQEYLSTLDKAEALQCVKDLGSKAWMLSLVKQTLQLVLDSMKEKEQTVLLELLLHLAQQGEISGEHLQEALTAYTECLEDVTIDFPKAPQLLGQCAGMAVAAGVLGCDSLPAMLVGETSVIQKRDFAAAAFKAVKTAKGGDAGLAEFCRAAGLSAASFLSADPVVDPDAPSVTAWLKATGLECVPE